MDLSPSTQLRTVAVCDLVDSTALIERLGDRRAADLFRRHDRVARDLLYRHHGREIDKTDGFLVLFERPIHAVAFALDYQRALRDLAAEEKVELAARVGVHVGDVLLWENAAEDVAKGAKPTEVEGLAKPLAARLMSLARPGQVLLSGMAHNLALRAQEDLGPIAEKVRWPAHGRYRFKGLPAPLLVYEVGEVGIAPLKAPPSSSKAQRELPLWRQPRALAVEAVVGIAAVLALMFVLVGRPQPAIAFGERDWVVMGDLRNLTGDPGVAEALETAFRISLEQSRFVNVLPELALRNALERMQEPADVDVDRAIGSEIAVREGARALILPTVADIGGRIRVSAEIVDPHTQTTVYAEAADGVGLESSLASMDLVTARLRLSLGETLQAIERDSEPLPRVTSGDLEALKVFAAAEQKMFGGDMNAARTLFARALEIDPGFALAHVGAARTAYSAAAFATVRQHLLKARGLTGRLTERDALYVDAWSTTMERPADGVERWRLLTSLYPDYVAGPYNAALFGWQYANQFEEGIAFVNAVIAEDSSRSATAHYLLGILKTGANRPDEALAAFAQATKLGLAGQGLVLLGAHLAAGDVPAARGVLQGMAANGGPLEPNLLLGRVAIGTTAGQFGEARNAAQEGAASLQSPWSRVFQAQGVQLAWAEGDAAAPELATTAANRAMQDLSAGGTDKIEVCAALLTIAHAALLLNESETAARSLAACAPVTNASGYAVLGWLQRAVAAQLAAREDNAAQALSALEDLTDHSPILVHAIRMQIAAQAGSWDVAQQEAQWLRRNRPRAHAEFVYQWVAMPASIIWTRAAALWEAEALLAAGRADEARQALATALRDAPWLDTPDGPFAPQLGRLKERLGTTPGSAE